MIKLDYLYFSTFLVNMLAIKRLSCYLAVFSIFKVGNEMLLHISVFIVSTIVLKLPFKTFDSLLKCYTRDKNCQLV